MEKNSGGILIPLCSPCDAQDRFLPGEFEQAVRLSLREPADGLYVCGGTGEGLKMRLEERKEACEIAVSAASGSGRHVLVQIGAHTWRDALELAEHAARTGADAISSIPLPDASQAELAAYYRAVAAASGLDTIIYLTPQSSQTVEQVLECLEIPGVTGVKSSSNDFFFTIRLLAELPQGKILFNGKDEYTVPAAVQGAHGGIGMWANVFPAAYADMYRLAKAGSFREAFALQTKLNELCCTAVSMGLLPSFSCILRCQGRWDRVFRAPAAQPDEAFCRAFLERTGTLLEELCTYGKGGRT
ncbi:MAG: dihydrodipicolinate synthase family protein [Oscillospiraceae bacterium]|nr:dihydrodipicolinate synthase family protein [Oscillospiraceae bacterium]